ncbi:hypothetical protein DLAC_08285 [Tieghemostelium lacteum]|uniref:Clu domain-containing protein n=1 Tax=Tieghemostelium lacteum TaxID=361077 RepID=A0A151ZBL1_TIELA|nr:hypothetical protein DLAC_08285 [Tieghemostelium lacteum]|eukprot:KYQ91337.1 hypothetical protein DLAC_08285 [Tieghemostelium lacteum]
MDYKVVDDINFYTTPDVKLQNYRYVFHEDVSESSSASSVHSYNANVVVYSPEATGNSLYFGGGEVHPSVYSPDDHITSIQEEKAWGDNLAVKALRNVEDYEFSKIFHWNDEFQKILDQEDSPERFQKLSTIANDFVYCADVFGKIIISELHLPMESKTIKPLDLGGVAGGQKFKCQDIIFKFAADTEIIPGLWMYGGTNKADSFAQKSTNHELNGLNHIMNIYGMKGGLIRFPMIAIIDYRGYRLLALSQLPISKSTIVYGSCDGGKTVHNSDSEINKEMERIAGFLNLRGHAAGLPKTFIYGPGDIEVHKGTDGRYYMLDFARMFPPEYPLIFNNKSGQKIGREIFYNMLRPELVRSFNVPLSSDGFSGWQTSLFENDLNRDITKATDYLHGHVIPNLINKINQTPEEDYSPSPHKAHEIVKNLKIVHFSGVNFRYLGVICKDVTVTCVKEVLITEIMARVWKRITRSRLRKTMDLTRRPSEDPYKTIIADIFKVLLDPTLPNQDQFWSEFSPGNLKYIAMEIFPRCLNEDEKKPCVDLRKLVDIKLLVIRFIQMLNIRINLSTFNQFLLTPDDRPFVQIGVGDIDEVGSTVKYPYLIDYSCGSQHMEETRRIVDNPYKEIDVLEADRSVDDGKMKFSNAMLSLPSAFPIHVQFFRALYFKSSVIKAPNEPIRILTVLLQYVALSNDDLQNTIAIQSLVGLYHLKLASNYLFFSETPSKSVFDSHLKLAKIALEKTLLKNPDCLDDLIINSIPTKHVYPPDLLSTCHFVPHERSVEYKKRKLYELFTLLYMLDQFKDSKIIQDVFVKYISQIQQIDNFELVEELELINSNFTLVHKFFDNLKNLKLLRLGPINMDTATSNHISAMYNLSYLTLHGVNFSALVNQSNSFFKPLLKHCKLLQLSIIDCKLDSNTFNGTHEQLQSLVYLELSNCQLPESSLLQISNHLKSLKKLVLNRSKDYSDSTICQILNTLQFQLEILDLNECFNLTDKITQVIIEHHFRLKYLSLVLPLLSEGSKTKLSKVFRVCSQRNNLIFTPSYKSSSFEKCTSPQYVLSYKSLRT